MVTTKHSALENRQDVAHPTPEYRNQRKQEIQEIIQGNIEKFKSNHFIREDLHSWMNHPRQPVLERTVQKNRIESTSEILRIYKKRTGWFAETTYASSYPTERSSCSDENSFGGLLQGTLIVGHATSIYQYNVEKNKWIDINKQHKNEDLWNMEYHEIYAGKGCAIGDSFLVYGQKCELLKFKPWLTNFYHSFPSWDEDGNLRYPDDGLVEGQVEEHANGAHNQHDSSPNVAIDISKPLWKRITDGLTAFAQPATSDISIKRKLPVRILRKPILCPTPIRVDGAPIDGGHSLINIGHDKVLLIGGNHMLLGELTWDKWSVKWKKLPSLYEKCGYGRIRHVAFKMRDHVYVAGGVVISSIEKNKKSLSCEKFHLKENKWSKCQYSLPFHLQDASVVVSPDQSFAVITGGTNKNYMPTSGIIIFEEETGFNLIGNKMLRKRSGHVSIPIL